MTKSRLISALPLLFAVALPAPAADRECVILLHGLWRTGMSMKALEWRLEDEGYAVANVTYPSLLYSIEELANSAMEEGVRECAAIKASPVSIVTHSLGGIIARHYLSKNTVPDLKRVVMLGPPNQGSQVADYFASLEKLDFLTPQAVDELTTGAQSVPKALGPVNFDLGVIAGTSSHSAMPISPDAVSDGTVSVEETKVEGMRDFIEVDAGHTFMMWQGDVIDQVIHFLERGRFAPVAAMDNE